MNLTVEELHVYDARDGNGFYLAREFNKLLQAGKFGAMTNVEEVINSSTPWLQTLTDHMISIRTAGSEDHTSELLALLVTDHMYDNACIIESGKMSLKINHMKNEFLNYKR